MSSISAAQTRKQNLADSAALKALNLAREAFDDAGYDVSVPGESEIGEFYASIGGVDIAVKIEIL